MSDFNKTQNSNDDEDIEALKDSELQDLHDTEQNCANPYLKSESKSFSDIQQEFNSQQDNSQKDSASFKKENPQHQIPEQQVTPPQPQYQNQTQQPIFRHTNNPNHVDFNPSQGYNVPPRGSYNYPPVYYAPPQNGYYNAPYNSYPNNNNYGYYPPTSQPNTNNAYPPPQPSSNIQSNMAAAATTTEVSNENIGTDVTNKINEAQKIQSNNNAENSNATPTQPINEQQTPNVNVNPAQPQQPYQQQVPPQPYAYWQQPYYPQNNFQQPIPNQAYGYAYWQQPKPPKKKMSKHSKIIIWIISILFILFLAGFITTLITEFSEDSHSLGSETKPSVSTKDPTEPNSVDYSDPNGPSIELVKPSSGDKASTKTAYEELSPSVVSVLTYERGSDNSDIYNMLGQGTGIIISSDGYIVTNSHVINDSKNNDVYITLKDGKEYPAKTIGFDKRTDIAVLKIDTTELPAATFADSKYISIGDDVVAIGNPGGIDYSNSITRGVISALERIVNDSTVLYIQTDAAINPGNSGGPLANMYGEVVGINTIKVVSPEYEGMGFAIPSTTIKEIADDLIKQGYVSDRVRIGITGTAVSEYAAKSDKNLRPGILIAEFSDDSPLPKEGAQVDDIITAVDGVEVNSFSSFYSELEKFMPGDTITLTLFRTASKNNGVEKSFNVEIKLLADNGETQLIETSDDE